jgi:hypothetical protein
MGAAVGCWPICIIDIFLAPEGTVQHSSSFLGRADTPAWPWSFAGGRCCWPVAFCHTVREGLVLAKQCLQEGSRHWVDVAEGAAAAGDNNWVDCGRKPKARWSCAFRQLIRP